MQQFARDKFSILEQSDTRFIFEQDLDLRHATRSKPRTTLYLEFSVAVLITVLIIFLVAWTITCTVCIIGIVLGFLSYIGSRWSTEGASCTKVEISKHKNRIKITEFQRYADGQIWHTMTQEHFFDLTCLEHLAITPWKEIKHDYGEMKKNIDDDTFVLNFKVKEQRFPVTLYIASTIEEMQPIKDQLELIHASPYQMAIS